MRTLHFVSIFFLGIGYLNPAMAATADDLLKDYAVSAMHEEAGFSGFSSESGKKLYMLEQIGKNGERVSCSTCHTNDPRHQGMTRANKIIEPLAPAVNSDRFTDREKVEKWFRRNCNDVLRRECTAREKGDFITFLRSIKK